MSPINSPGITTGDLEADTFTTGTINGVSYAYGTNTYFATGNASRIDQGSFTESSNITTTTTETINLITNISSEPINIYYQVWQIAMSAVENRTSEMWYDQTSLEVWLNTTLELPSLTNFNVTADYSIETGILLDQNEEFLGQFPVNTTSYSYNRVINAVDVFVFGIIVPKAIIFDVTREAHNLVVTREIAHNAYMGYYTEFARAYNISATAHQVEIRNGDNLALSFNMFDTIEANYTEYLVSALSYFIYSYDVTTLTFTNGTAVDYAFYPRNMLPKVYTGSGTIIEAGYQQVETKLLSTFQSVTAVFATVEDEINPTNLTIQARLAIWGIQSPTTMVAFDDYNNNGKLDLTLSEGGLEVASEDSVSHLGLAEAYQSSVFTARYRSHVFNSSFNLFGLGIEENVINANETDFSFEYAEFNFGNVNAVTESQLVWNAPTEDVDGNVIFDFGVDYTNFPVTWINTRDGSVVEDIEDISYHYKVIVNPATGMARISPTWTYGGITDTNLAADMNGKSLALIVKSEFFALQATYTATETNDTLESSRTSGFGQIGVAVGGGSATEIDVTGPKQYYTLNNTTTETASFEAINLIQVAGHFEGERISPFESESENTGGTASMAVVETLTVDFFYSASLVIITYPAWSGGSVVHDPDYNVSYDAPEVDVEPTDDPTDETTSDPISTDPVSSEVPASVTPESPIPGFVFITTFTAMSLGIIFKKKKLI